MCACFRARASGGTQRSAERSSAMRTSRTRRRSPGCSGSSGRRAPRTAPRRTCVPPQTNKQTNPQRTQDKQTNKAKRVETQTNKPRRNKRTKKQTHRRPCASEAEAHARARRGSPRGRSGEHIRHGGRAQDAVGVEVYRVRECQQHLRVRPGHSRGTQGVLKGCSRGALGRVGRARSTGRAGGCGRPTHGGAGGWEERRSA